CSAVAAPQATVSDFMPATSMLTFANVTTPLASVAVAPPPLSVPGPSSASDAAPPATALPNASVTLTCSAGEIATPGVTFVGCVRYWRAAGAPADTANALLVAPGSTPLEAMSCLLPTSVRLRLLNVATPPPLLAIDAPPESAPVPTSASVMGAPV